MRVLQHTDPVQLVAFAPPATACTAGLAAAGAAQAHSAASGGVTSPRQQTQSSRLVTGCEGRALWLWDVQSGACVAALGEHKEAVMSVCFSSDGQWLASTSQDRSVLVWQAETGRLAGIYVGDAAMVCCTFAVRGSGQTGGQTTGAGQPQLQQRDSQEGGGGGSAGLAQPSGLTLLVGSASGRVHFVDCL